MLLALAAHQSPPGWEPFSKAGIAAPFSGRFHRKGDPLPSYLSVADDLGTAAHAALDEFLAQHDPTDPEAPSPDAVARRLSIFRMNGARVLVADGADTLKHLGAHARHIEWGERSSWGYCQEAASLATEFQLDGVVCSSAVEPESCRTIALFHAAQEDILVPEHSLEDTVAELRRRVLEDSW